MELAKQKGISMQAGATGGFTDALPFLARGVPALMLSVPVRYLHSPVEMIDRRDLEGLLKLLLAVTSVDREKIPV